MGLSVISSLPKGINLPATSQNSPLVEGLPGAFAALLSGELPSAGHLIAEFTGNTPSTNRLLKDPRLPTGKEISTTSPARSTDLPGELMLIKSEELLASETAPGELSGKLLDSTRAGESSKRSIEDLLNETTSLLDPATLASATGNPTLPPEIPLRGVSNNFKVGTEMLEQRITEVNSEGSDSKSSNAEDLEIFEKLISTTSRLSQGTATPNNEAASFAAETNAVETGNSPLAGAVGANTRQSREVLAADQSNIHTHLRESSWSQQFGEKIVWLAKNDQQSAQININPPELGPVQITLNLSGDQAKVVFASPHAEVRQAIESALPQLKEMLSSAGISLGQTNVGANMAQQNPDNPYQTGNGKHLPGENAILPANDKALSTSTSSVLQRGRGLVDLFA